MSTSPEADPWKSVGSLAAALVEQARRRMEERARAAAKEPAHE